MSDVNAKIGPESPSTVYCPRCGQAMLVAPQHIQTTVACPHCQQPLEPSHVVATVPPGSAQRPTPPQYGYGPPPVFAGYSWRNRWLAGALGVLLGGFGVHRFYLGFTGIGFAQIAATVLTLGIVGPIWGFIEGILCFCGAMRDVDGLPLRG